VNDLDASGHSTWSWTGGGLFILANVDDDDGDGQSDAADARVNGLADEADLAPLVITLSATPPRGSTLSLSRVDARGINVFQKGASGAWTAVRRSLSITGNIVYLGVEATRFSLTASEGAFSLVVELRDRRGTLLSADSVAMRVAPWIMIPNSAPTEAVHVATGQYPNAAFLSELAAATSGLMLTPYNTSHWQEMWMQDTMEIGYTQLPGREPLHVVLKANRAWDTYPPTLLGPNFGTITVGAYRNTSGPANDFWVDWYGNLEVSPPTPDWPLGRIYYGFNTNTGVHLQDAVVDFLRAQYVQSPFWLDTSWLMIKHVDEMVSFVPGPDGEPKLLVASPREAGTLYPSHYGPIDQGIQAKIDAALHGAAYSIGGQTVVHPGMLDLLGLDDTAVVELPIFYSATMTANGPVDGTADWSSPINSTFFNGTLLAGDTNMSDPERQMTERRLADIGINVFWLNDAVYHQNLGNVHCATNTTRAPLVVDFSRHLPSTFGDELPIF